MEVELSICLTQPSGATPCITCSDGKTISFNTPRYLTEANFPATDTTFSFDTVFGPNAPNPEVHDSKLSKVAEDFCQSNQNCVLYTYGQKAVPKRQFLYGVSKEISGSITASAGMAQRILQKVFALDAGASTFKMYAYVLGVTESVTDLLNPENTSAAVSDSVKDGPNVSNLTYQEVTSYDDVVRVLKKATASIEDEFSEVMMESRQDEAFPPYAPFHIMFGMLKYPNQEALESGVETNSLHFVTMGDSERPALCGINLDALNKYEKTHKTHTSMVAVLGAIRCNRLRVPFTKSKLSSLLKRAYNQEKNNPNNENNKPTKTFLFVFVFNDEDHAEESYHTLTTAKRINSVMGVAGVGPASRDLSVEKWRLEQDILELKDELAIAKAVHEYKPCIYDQSKPVQNIQEEEFKRITNINKKREDARVKAQAEMRLEAEKQAQIVIQQEEQKSSSNLQELEAKLKEKTLLNSELNSERDKKIKEFDKQLEKIRKKKVEEEEKANKLKEEIQAIEEELAVRNESIKKAKDSLDVLNQDHSKGREMIMQSREDTKKKREEIYDQRRAQREAWLKDIEDLNKKVLAQVRYLAQEKSAAGITKITDDDIKESEVAEEVESIRKFLPKLINIDSNKMQTPSNDKIRQQLEEYFESEKQNFKKKIEQESVRKVELEKAADMYRARIAEHQNRIKKDQLQEAVKKESHLKNLIEQVIQYLEHGCRMTKIPSKGNFARKRYFFIADDRKKLCSCEIDEMGQPVNRKRPSATFLFKDIKRVVLGQYTAGYDAFKKQCKKGQQAAADDDEDGSYNEKQTQNVTPQNTAKYMYRSFSLEFKKAKNLELVTETDSDFEAWIVALKRLLGTESEWEKIQDQKAGKSSAGSEPPPSIEWGAALDLSSKASADKLSKDEAALCSTYHITPNQYLNAKTEILAKSQSSYITVYDVRTHSSLDLPRSQVVYEYFMMKKLIPSLTDASD